MRGYMQLTKEERYQIYILKKAEYSQAEIAELLERNKSTFRENRWAIGYPMKSSSTSGLR